VKINFNIGNMYHNVVRTGGGVNIFLLPGHHHRQEHTLIPIRGLFIFQTFVVSTIYYEKRTCIATRTNVIVLYHTQNMYVVTHLKLKAYGCRADGGYNIFSHYSHYHNLLTHIDYFILFFSNSNTLIMFYFENSSRIQIHT